MQHTPAPAANMHLLLSLAEQLKLPFLQISQQAELAELATDPTAYPMIASTAQTALKLIDSYLLSIRLTGADNLRLIAEPVSVSSVLYDVGHELTPMAKAYDVSLDLRLEGKFEPVMAHRYGLESALTSLGMALIEALPAADTSHLSLQLSAHRCRYGIVAGLYCDAENLSAETLRQGRQLYGRARQPLTALSAGSGVGIFVADALLKAMSSQLTTSRHKHLRGLGAVLQPNSQLQLV